MHHHGTDWTYWINLVANLGIVAGYLLVPFTVLPRFPLTVNVRLAGTFFFATCAFDHMAMAFGFSQHGVMTVNHIVQAVAVIWFVLGFYLLLRAADTRRHTGGGDHR